MVTIGPRHFKVWYQAADDSDPWLLCDVDAEDHRAALVYAVGFKLANPTGAALIAEEFPADQRGVESRNPVTGAVEYELIACERWHGTPIDDPPVGVTA